MKYSFMLYQYIILIALIALTACGTTSTTELATDTEQPAPLAMELSKTLPPAETTDKLEEREQETQTQAPESVEITEAQIAEAVAKIAPAGNLWERVESGFAFKQTYPFSDPKANKRVEKHIKRITRSSRILNGTAKRATPYLYFVVSELEKHNIPLEIALLPIVESGYDPFAYSSGRASGLWQFIPGTGKRFGLQQNWWQDERRDTITATGSAIQYLLYLHNRFDDDWLLALSAYNAGQGNVAKAVRKNKKAGKAIDFWSLSLPKETQDYVPKLLAWREVLLNQEKYDVVLEPIPDQAFFAVVDIGSQIDLAEAAKLAEVDIDTIYQLNPAFNRWATDPEPPHDLLVPVAAKSLLEQKLKDLPADQRMTWKRYIIKPNDSLGKIAKKFGTSVKLIGSINGLKSHRIRAGGALLIPSASQDPTYYSKSVEQRLAHTINQEPKKNQSKKIHQVQSGETLWDISRAYNVKVSSLARWNNMSPKDVLSVNQKLVVWSKKSLPSQAKVQAESSKTKRKLFYKVRNGDSLSHISQKFNVGVKEIKDWNNIHQEKYIKPGQLLTLYVTLTDRALGNL